ncbi:phytanoyl-CoA dioxygenase family protein [Spirosoma areae]
MGTFEFTFNQCVPAEAADELKDGRGFIIFENALSETTLSRIRATINLNEYLVNNNFVGVVHAQRMNFHSHTLAVSKDCYDIVTNEKVRTICNHFFKAPHKLSNQRIFETHTKAHMPWHTDNNLQSGNTFTGKHTLPGLLFLLYLSDVSDTNPFQLIPDSHKWSAKHNERFFADEYIEQDYADHIVTVRAPKGTFVICNTHLIHRAEPFNRPGFKRLTYLFQVDALSEAHPEHGEKLLINPSFVDDTSPGVLSYLGFGLESNYPTFPQTSVSSMLPHDLWLLQKSIFPKAVHSLLFSVIKSLIPSNALIMLKNINPAKWSFKSLIGHKRKVIN